MNSPGPIVFFDGVCNLCNGAVQYMIRNDKKKQFRFASLQSRSGQEAARQVADDAGGMATIILLYKGKYYKRSSAVLKIASLLGGMGWLLLPGYFLPPFLRDAMYNAVAKRRYRWFGKRDECMIPTPELKARFLED